MRTYLALAIREYRNCQVPLSGTAGGDSTPANSGRQDRMLHREVSTCADAFIA
ncbi:MAG: hypothetical protein ACLR6J_09710 [Parabacteroides merdae]